MLASVTELIQYMLWLYLLLPDCFTFDAVLKIESTQTGYSDLLVHKLAMKQFTALLHSESSPESERLLIEQELNMLLLQLARLRISLSRRYPFDSTAADMLDSTVWHRKCF